MIYVPFPPPAWRGYQFRGYLFQARSLIPSDQTGLSDPFARILVCNRVATTQVLLKILAILREASFWSPDELVSCSSQSHKSSASSLGKLMQTKAWTLTFQVVMESLSPTWDETIILESVVLYGDPDDIKASPPLVVVEVYDFDTLVWTFELVTVNFWTCYCELLNLLLWTFELVTVNFWICICFGDLWFSAMESWTLGYS